MDEIAQEVGSCIFYRINPHHSSFDMNQVIAKLSHYIQFMNFEQVDLSSLDDFDIQLNNYYVKYHFY